MVRRASRCGGAVRAVAGSFRTDPARPVIIRTGDSRDAAGIGARPDLLEPKRSVAMTGGGGWTEAAGEGEGRRFHVVVLGTGPVGKTSLINALLGRSAGPTGATMGATAHR